MASIGHIAVGMAAARVAGAERGAAQRVWVSMLGWSVLSLLPDADVIGFRYGVAYAAPWGHRGATHSFAFALAVTVIVYLLRRGKSSRRFRNACITALVVGSHAVLDTMTDGGLGCALLWPFDLSRYFAPWTPIPVAPIGPRFLSAAGLHVALAEAVLFSPAFVYALWPRRKS